MVGDLHIRIAKLAFHAKESPTPESRTPSVAPELGFNDDESGAQILFGVARRVPSLNTSK